MVGKWDVEVTDQFVAWWDSLNEAEQVDVAASVGLLEACGPLRDYPHSSGIKGSRHPRMRELRVQHKGKPYRILYVFDPRRVAILLIGGNKVGNDRWYEIFVPEADRLYDEHLRVLREEGIPDDEEVCRSPKGHVGGGKTGGRGKNR